MVVIDPAELSPLGRFLFARQLLHYLPALEHEEITLDMLPMLTDDDLACAGVHSLGARLQILMATRGGATMMQTHNMSMSSSSSSSLETTTTPATTQLLLQQPPHPLLHGHDYYYHHNHHHHFDNGRERVGE